MENLKKLWLSIGRFLIESVHVIAVIERKIILENWF